MTHRPYLVGLVKDATGSTDGGLVALALILLAGALLATRVVHDPHLERAPREEPRFTRDGAPAGVSRGRRTASGSPSPS